MNSPIRALHILLLVAAGAGAFVLARELAVHDAGPAVAEAAERVIVPVPATEPAAATPAPGEADQPASSSVRPAFGAERIGDPFQKLSFTPPPVVVAPAPPAPPPAPRAPPLPFTFIGLIEHGKPRPSAFLARGEDLIAVAAGDVLDQIYRIDSLTANEIVFTYLPLNERQTIALAGGPK